MIEMLNFTRKYVLVDIISYMEGVIKSFTLFLCAFAMFGFVGFVRKRLFWRKYFLARILDAVTVGGKSVLFIAVRVNIKYFR